MAIISHELRTPISGIIGNLELLEHRIKDELSKSMLQNAILSAGKLKLLVDDILDFSKLDASQLKISHEKVNVAKELSPVLGIMKH
ncbi:hypothetical protein D1115_03700 [Vibrio alfacsensis]|uniref:histidine kinase n=1 Tax=Vibrio alfacsensis TaxID=1074311 RepID=A0ABM6YS83_9VIBR|nr:histidine kinase dimerization/phospho-acceptor domain-containing protein [Vibrio alfacsensis]AXY00470.1 hypothetical protein D1115_03700 [Vibrio alfacsensis]